MNDSPHPHIAVIGLGYVGLPLAIAFGQKFETVGYDINAEKISHFINHHDPTGEVSQTEFESARRLTFTTEPQRISEADFIIVAVPTPIDPAHQPDLQPLKAASETVAGHMKKGAVVVFESTVYPGVTEEVCVPILEQTSGLGWKRDFHVGYSPERINPGDKEHTLARILKVVAADGEETLKQVAALYEAIVEAGVFCAASIKEAEAAKVIENTQRDLNIALINELAIIFDKLGIDTTNVLRAAGTKWNFLPFRPGLVGGHCIGVDPYYLTYKAETVGYHPQVILAGRRINDNMGKFIAEKAVKLVILSNENVRNARVGVFGLTFKEDCPDIRNTRVMDIVRELESYGIDVMVHDPLADPEEARRYCGISLCAWQDLIDLRAMIIAVAHRAYKEMNVQDFTAKLAPGGCLVDVKAMLDPKDLQDTGIRYWRM
jgi:UDP-N-acetyl-D-galactosamine dehydrogenase